MDQTKRAKRVFSPEQKLHIVQAIDADIKGGMRVTAAVKKAGVVHSCYRQWKRQLAVGIRSSLRNGRAPVDKDRRRLEKEVEKLKAIVLSQSQMIADLKKETNWD
jgi:transposase-like protein